VVTYNILLRASAQLDQFERVQSLFKEMQSAGIAPDIYSYNGVIDAYGKSKQYMQMESVLRVMRAAHCKPDLVTYNTLLDAYGRVADFAKMEQVGFLYNLCFLRDFGAGFSAQMLHILDLFLLRK
jgi:pentatricopeptide repeat protein